MDNPTYKALVAEAATAKSPRQAVTGFVAETIGWSDSDIAGFTTVELIQMSLDHLVRYSGSLELDNQALSGLRLDLEGAGRRVAELEAENLELLRESVKLSRENLALTYRVNGWKDAGDLIEILVQGRFLLLVTCEEREDGEGDFYNHYFHRKMVLDEDALELLDTWKRGDWEVGSPMLTLTRDQETWSSDEWFCGLTTDPMHRPKGGK